MIPLRREALNLFVLGWIVLVAFTDGGVPTMLAFAVLWGVSAGIGAQAFYSLWASEMFATPYRASAQGVMFFVVRSVTGLLSYFFPTLLAVTGLTGVGLLLIGLLTVVHWRWGDHKTVLSLASWATFAALIVGRRTRGWRGRQATRWVYAGAVLMLLAYAGSRFVFEVVLQRAPTGLGN